MHRRRIELLLDTLEVIQSLERVVELRAFLLTQPGFHLGDGPGELRAVELGDRGRPSR